jgi:hypothetical protein
MRSEIRAPSKNLTRRANHRHIFIIARTLKPAPETGGGIFELAFFKSGGGCRRITFVPPQSCSPVRRGAFQGNRDEETACCGGDRRIIFFSRSERSGSCRKCCPGRGVGSCGSRTGGRRGGCADRIYRWTRDRAFLGCRAFRPALAPAACHTSRRRHRAAGDRQRNSTAGCQAGRNGRGKNRAAGCQGTRNRCRKNRAAGPGF